MKIPNMITHALLSTNSPYVCIPRSRNTPPIIAFGGTQSVSDIFQYDLNIKPKKWPASVCTIADSDIIQTVTKNTEFADDDSEYMTYGYVHAGFASRTKLILENITEFVEKNDRFILGGHSLGGSCAILAASMLVSCGKRVEHIYTFGVPRSVCKSFVKTYKYQDLWDKTTNYVTPYDPIVNLIPKLYRNVGKFELLEFDNKKKWLNHDLITYHTLIKDRKDDKNSIYIMHIIINNINITHVIEERLLAVD